MYTASKQFRRNSAHRLDWYDGVCGNVHGHNYKAEVSFDGELDEQGMVIDFKDLSPVQKRIDANRDHAYLYQQWDVVGEFLKEQRMRVYELLTAPTTEHLCAYLATKVEELIWVLPDEVVIHETEKCVAKWRK